MGTAVKQDSFFRKATAFLLVFGLCFQLAACGFTDKVKDAGNAVSNAASSAKTAVVNWYKGLDFSVFEKGWEKASEFVGNAYTTVVTTDYISAVNGAINNLKTSINSAYGSARGIAQEAGFAAERWAAETFNIDALARGSSNRAEVVGSNELGSVDVATNYGENASLKYYQDATGSAQAQAQSIVDAYRQYCNKTKQPMSFEEYLNKHGYDNTSQDALLASVYEGQTRIIPTDQLAEARDYLTGRINKLSAIDGDVASARTKAYQETLVNLKDRLQAPDGTQSTPITYEQLQAIAELSQKGEFKPEDFGIKLSQVITPKYVLKQAMGTGLEVGAIRAILTTAPDIVSIIVESVKEGKIDEQALEKTGIEGVVAMSEGFVEGAISRVVITMSEQGLLGNSLKAVDGNVIGAFVFLTLEAMFTGYSLVKGDITTEEYGILMADKTLITLLAVPTTEIVLSLLPATLAAMKLFTIIGCLAGGMIAATGYMVAKEIVLEFIDGGGFEAIVPQGFKDGFVIIKDKISSLNISEQVTNLKNYAVTTLSDGYIKLKGIFS